MWLLVRAAVAWVLGDDVVRFVVSVVVGLFVFAWVQSMGVTHAILAQPFGQHWLAGTMGGPSAAQPIVGGQGVRVPEPRAAPGVPVPSSDATVATLIANAASWLGVPYLWGGCTRAGVDCSCLVQNVMRTVGVSAPRTTKPQFVWGTPVAREDVRAGDLVFFNDTCRDCGPNPTHVGLAIDNARMIHAGDPVQISTIASFGTKYAGARRPPL